MWELWSTVSSSVHGSRTMHTRKMDCMWRRSAGADLRKQLLKEVTLIEPGSCFNVIVEVRTRTKRTTWVSRLKKVDNLPIRFAFRRLTTPCCLKIRDYLPPRMGVVTRVDPFTMSEITQPNTLMRWRLLCFISAICSKCSCRTGQMLH